MNENCKICGAVYTSSCWMCLGNARLELLQSTRRKSLGSVDNNGYIRGCGRPAGELQRPTIRVQGRSSDASDTNPYANAIVAEPVPATVVVEFGDQRVEFSLEFAGVVEFNIGGRHFKFERKRR